MRRSGSVLFWQFQNRQEFYQEQFISYKPKKSSIAAIAFASLSFPKPPITL